jgi:antitoxin PrlF
MRYCIRKIVCYEKMDQSTIQQNGQITIPPSMLNYLNLHAGDSVSFSLDAGSIHLIPSRKRSVMDLEGILPKPKKALSIEEMNQIIQEQYDRS